MLEEQDIQKLAQVFATKAELQAAMSNLLAKNDEILNAIDAYTNKADTYFQEMVMLSRKVVRHERWIMQIAEKLGVTLKA